MSVKMHIELVCDPLHSTNSAQIKDADNSKPNAWENEDQINLLKSTGYMMHQQFKIQEFYILPTLYLCVLYLSEKKQRLVPLTA